jgi:hypothetical protein
MKWSWSSSPESSSRVLPLVSGRRRVEKIPVLLREKKKRVSMPFCLSKNGGNSDKQHKEREDLQDVRDEGVLSSTVLELESHLLVVQKKRRRKRSVLFGNKIEHESSDGVCREGERARRTIWAMIAPSLPDPAEIP